MLCQTPSSCCCASEEVGYRGILPSTSGDQNMIRHALAIAVLMTLAGLASADVAPPMPAPKEYKVSIEVNDNVKSTQVIIPWGAVNEPRRRPLPPKEKIGAAGDDPTLRVRWTLAGSA